MKGHREGACKHTTLKCVGCGEILDLKLVKKSADKPVASDAGNSTHEEHTALSKGALAVGSDSEPDGLEDGV